MLYDWTNIAIQLGNVVVYRDTDSLHCIDGSELPTSIHLGALKLEYDGPAIYNGRKLYRLTDIAKNKVKGIPHKVSDQWTNKDFLSILDGKSIQVWYETPSTPLEVLSESKKPAVWNTRTRTISRFDRESEESFP